MISRLEISMTIKAIEVSLYKFGLVSQDGDLLKSQIDGTWCIYDEFDFYDALIEYWVNK